MQGIHVVNSKHVTHTHNSDSLLKVRPVPLLSFQPHTYYSRTRLPHERTGCLWNECCSSRVVLLLWLTVRN